MAARGSLDRVASKPANKRLRLLCLHSFRTSAVIFRQQFKRSGLLDELDDLVDLEFIDAPHAASGPAPPDVQAFFQPPFYQWCTAEQVLHPASPSAADEDGLSWRYIGVEEGQEYVIRHLNEHGPYDGIVGFSQGALLGSALLAMKQAGFPEAQAMPDLRMCLMIGSAKSRYGRHLEAFAAGKIGCRSLHLIGEKDQYRKMAVELVDCFEGATVINHPRGHVVPPLQADKLATLRNFLLSFGPTSAL